ncbi:MAG TPA: prepilin-type N-terminal cleavage/methylation domain-containing protein [Planctomycetota bacterium]|nr:prepilin-type N-terminal cleavage/methylation domain-containing protein [Planctomycetota bacterium]
MSNTNGRGFTLIELLSVVAIIIIVLALALPNFASMIRWQRWAAASGALQNALLRCQTYAVNDRQDHSIEICVDTDNTTQYFRLEVESALLETIAELNTYYRDQCEYYYMRLPVDWLRTFKNGGGQVVNPPDHPWGAYPNTSFTYPDAPYYDVSSPWDPKTKDNLKVDEHISLPHSIRIDFAASTNLMNYDARPRTTQAIPQYGWDYTPDLRFNMSGVLIQAKNPEIMLKNNAGEQMRLQVLRSTARVRTLSGVSGSN